MMKLMDDSTGCQGNNVITQLNVNDVLCGRGSGPNDYSGNIKFRALVMERREEYLSTSNRASKAKIAREIVDRVHNLMPAGRFLEQVEGSGKVSLWRIVSEEKALEKAKQALRQNRHRRGGGSGSMGSLGSGSMGNVAVFAGAMPMNGGGDGHMRSSSYTVQSMSPAKGMVPGQTQHTRSFSHNPPSVSVPANSMAVHPMPENSRNTMKGHGRSHAQSMMHMEDDGRHVRATSLGADFWGENPHERSTSNHRRHRSDHFVRQQAHRTDRKRDHYQHRTSQSSSPDNRPYYKEHPRHNSHQPYHDMSPHAPVNDYHTTKRPLQYFRQAPPSYHHLTPQASPIDRRDHPSPYSEDRHYSYYENNHRQRPSPNINLNQPYLRDRKYFNDDQQRVPTHPECLDEDMENVDNDDIPPPLPQDNRPPQYNHRPENNNSAFQDFSRFDFPDDFLPSNTPAEPNRSRMFSTESDISAISIEKDLQPDPNPSNHDYPWILTPTKSCTPPVPVKSHSPTFRKAEQDDPTSTMISDFTPIDSNSNGDVFSNRKHLDSLGDASTTSVDSLKDYFDPSRLNTFSELQDI